LEVSLFHAFDQAHPTPSPSAIDPFLSSTIDNTRGGHTGLFYPYNWATWHVEEELVAFYEKKLGMKVERRYLDDNPDGTWKDRGGRGYRYDVLAGHRLWIVYCCSTHTALWLRRNFYGLPGFHVCLPLNQMHLERVCALPEFEGKTEWHQTKRSVQLTGPWNLELELQHPRSQE